MDKTQTEINTLLKKAGLGEADEVRHLGHGELNNSYYAKVGADEYCVRVAKYDLKAGLAREADALARLPQGIAPRLVYFDKSDALEGGRLWAVESFVAGDNPKRLSLEQFRSLGAKLAKVHAVKAPDHDIVDKGEVTNDKSDLWHYLTWTCRSMYTPRQILTDLPDQRVLRLAQKAKVWLDTQQKLLTFPEQKRMLHKDVTPSNMLVQGDETFLIDWEFRDFGDPMIDFSTGFWDMELNEGKWRITLTDEEWAAMFDGYRAAGGEVDEGRIRMWMTFDKMVVALFLCLRINSPTHDTTQELQAQYRKDLDNVIASLEQQF